MASKVRNVSKAQPESTSRVSGTGTFRLDVDLLDGLKEEAEQKRTSLNTLVSQVLRSHAEYHTFSSKGGMISMPKNLLIRLMERLSEQEVIALSEHIAKNDLKDTVLMMKSNYTADSVMDFIESWTRVGGYPYRHHVENNSDGKSERKHTFVMQHDMGERWSLYFLELFRFAFQQTGVRLNFQHTANTITFEAEF
jgi:hypothetical protein